MIRIYIAGFKEFSRNKYNLLDFFLSMLSISEIIIVGFDLGLSSWTVSAGLVALVLRNVIMILRIFIIMRRSLKSKKDKPVKVTGVIINKDPPSMESILESNIENLKYAFRARLDTLGEEDEMLESSLANTGSVWKGRIQQSPKIVVTPN